MADEVTVGLVAALLRYPVKSFGGERLRKAFVGPYGIAGDRRLALIGEDGAVVSARRATALLAFGARFPDHETLSDARITTPDGDEFPADDPMLARALTRAVGREVRMAQGAVGVFDAAPIHIVTDASLRQMDRWVGDELDTRRFRPNVVLELESAEPFAEATWQGRRIRLGAVEMEVVSPTERCVVTTVDPDTGERDRRVQTVLARERDNLFGVYAMVVSPGWVHVGDAAVLHGPEPGRA